MNAQSIFSTGGLNVMQPGSTSLFQQGPGYGYYGSNDLFNPNANKENVLGVSTQAAQPTQPVAQQPVQQVQNPTNVFQQQQESAINNGWDSYTGQLNDMLNNGLTGQRAAQESIANNTYNQGIADLGTQRSQSEQSVSTQQAKNIKDLTNNMQNLFQSGNTYLGSRGAGDSSAANQYSYALTKMGTQARGDIQTQATDRLNQINDIYNSESNRLKTARDNKIAEIASWFNDAQNNIRTQIASAGQGKQKDLQNLSAQVYNSALQQLQDIQSQVSNRQSALESWAISNSQNVQQLIANMKTVQTMPAFQGLSGAMPQVTSEGGMYVPTGYSTGSSQKRDIFGNVIQ